MMRTVSASCVGSGSALARGAIAVLGIAFLSSTPVRARSVLGGSQQGPDSHIIRAGVGWPSGFIENTGQWETEAAFVARFGAVMVRAESGAVALQHGIEREDGSRHGSLVRLVFEGAASAMPRPVQSASLPGRLHFLLGNEPAKWRTEVPRFAEVDYGEIVPGVRLGLILDGSKVALRLGAEKSSDLDAVRLRVEGSKAVHTGFDGDGSLRLGTRAGELRLSSPHPLPGLAGDAERGPWRFSLLPDERIALSREGTGVVPNLVLDLQLEWSTYLGGAEGGEYIRDLVLDSQGRPIVVGETRSPDFPVTPGAFDTSWNGGFGTTPEDVFITCLSADGAELIYSTFLGGSHNDDAQAVLRTPSGALIVAGNMYSADFPITPGAFDQVQSGLEGFVAGLSADGSRLDFSTYFGGSSTDSIRGAALMQDGRIAICGATTSADLPVTPGCLDATISGYDGYFAVIDELGQGLSYASFLGGDPTNEVAFSVTQLPAGPLAVVGRSYSPDFPPTTPGAFATTMTGTASDYVLAINVDTNQLVYSSYLPACLTERIEACADGTVIVAGTASSLNFPATPGAYQTVPASVGTTDAFVLRLDPTGSSLVYATLLGGAHSETLADLTVDSAGRATVVGMTYSAGFPTTNGCFMPTKPAPLGGIITDMFVTQFDVDGSRLIYSTYLAGPEGEGAAAVAFDASGSAVVGGATDGNFPVTPGAYDPEEPATFDATVSKLSMLPTGVLKFGASTPGPSGPLAIGVTSMPALGSDQFGLTCLSAPPSTTGLLVLAGAPLATPVLAKGLDLWLSPATIYVLIPVTSNVDGYSVLPLDVPNDPRLVGVPTYWQYAWPAPGGGPWSASNALQITIEP